jgi:peptidoglycan LD-endopeptidase LytH
MDVKTLLQKHRASFGRVLSLDYHSLKCFALDLSRTNPDIRNINFADPKEHQRYISGRLGEHDAIIGIGRYDEDRIIYDHSTVFAGKVRRTIHLGIDIFVNPNTKVLCPYDAKVHSFQDNKGQGDYGPTIILEHVIDGIKFYTLYGHLSRTSLEGLHEGKIFHKGDTIATIGDMDINGGWPSHLHFQIITDMQGNIGDYPGVSSVNDRTRYLELCPNPNLILQINGLE